MSVSRRTLLFSVGALALSVGLFALAATSTLDPAAQLAVVDLAEPLLLCLCSLMVFWMALRFSAGEPLRRQWVPIGVGVLLFALGDLVYGAWEVSTGAAPPSPGLADALYALSYPLIGAGVVQAALGYRRLVRIGPLIAASLALGAIVLGATILRFAGAIGPEAGVGLTDAGLTLAFPVADVIFIVVPATLVSLVALRMRGAWLAAPWLAVALGGAVFAASDVWFLYHQLAGTYRGGAITDMGWMIGGVLIATGASLAADINRVPVRTPRRDDRRAPSPSTSTNPTS